MHTDAPHVQSADMRFRLLEAGDLAAWYAYLSAPGFLSHTSWAVNSVEGLADQLVPAIGRTAGHFRLALTHGPHEALLGTIGLHGMRTESTVAEIGYDVHPAKWGQGLATLMVQAVVDWAYERLGLNRIHGLVSIDNDRSRRVLEKAGFSFVERRPGYRIVQGKHADFDLFSRPAALSLSDWPGATTGLARP